MSPFEDNIFNCLKFTATPVSDQLLTSFVAVESRGISYPLVSYYSIVIWMTLGASEKSFMC